jgi:hypothetical protein
MNYEREAYCDKEEKGLVLTETFNRAEKRMEEKSFHE